MPRRGGPSTLTGVDYQVIYTATRFAEAITSDSILSLRPEAHVTDAQIAPSSQSDSLAVVPPAVDDLTITHREGPSEFISLKHQAGQASWNTSQFIERGILTAFFQQHRSDPLARLLLVTQSPIEAPLRDCVERAKNATAESLSTLGREPEQTFKKIVAHIQQEQPDTSIATAEAITFLSKIEFHILPQESLEKEILLVLQPHVQDADAAKNVLYQYAMQAGKQQKRVTPESIRQELLQRGQPLIVPPAAEAIMDQFDEVSTTLNDVPANIGHLPGYHIDRAEVTEVVSWVLEPLPFPRPGESLPARISRIIIGGAGVGKTVVLRDIYRALRECHLPVIALKADRTNGTTKGGLLADIRENGLSYSLQQALAAVASPERPAVVIVDQLDALSMCLSAERGLLNSYTELLNDLHRLPNVRFILSCRTFDLKHDPELAPFQAAKTVEVSVLSIEQVDKVLEAAGLTLTSALSAELVNLLQTPLHLSLYCALDDDARSGAPITSIQGLYDKLLLQFLTHPKRLPSNVTPNQVRDFLYAMAIAMHENQQLMLPHLFWYDQDTNVFNYLSSQAVIVKTGQYGQQVTFFHQTFYEYLFARQFVAKRQSLTDFILSSGQGLFLRSMIQQVLSFLRGSDYEAYLLALRQLLGATACRFHLRILIAQFLASQSKPDADEISIARELVLPNSNLLPAFIEVASARPWMELLAEPAVFHQLVPALENTPMATDTTLASPLLWNLARYAPDLAMLRLQELPEGPHRKDWIIKSLDDMGACDDATVTILFEQVFRGELTAWQQLMRWHILNKQARIKPEWVSTQVFEQLANAPFSDNEEHTRREDYQEAETINSLWKASAPLCFDLCRRLLRTWIRRGSNYRDPQLSVYVWRKNRYGLYPAPYFLDQKDVSSRNETPHSAEDAVLHYTWKYLEDSGNLLLPNYRPTVIKWLNSRTKLLVQMALAAINANPEPFTDYALRLFSKKGWLPEAAHRNHIGYFTLRIFPHAWDAASVEQRRLLVDELLSVGFMHDVDIYTDQKGKRIYCSRHGRDALKYLQALGTERLSEFPALKRKAEEFTRLWKKLPDEQPGRRTKVTRRGYSSPATDWKIEKLTPADWLRALEKYRNKERTVFSDEGTYTGLCHHLNDLIKTSPYSWVSLLEHLVESEDESVAMLLPTLNESDSDAAASLLESAYHRNLLSDEAYRRLKRNARKKSSGPEEEIKPEYVKHDLAEVMANLQAQSTIQFEDKNHKRDLLTAALNTPGAMQLRELLREKLPEDLVPEVVAVLKEVAAKGSLPVRTAAIEPLAMLIRTALPAQVTIDLFNELIGADYVLLAAGQWSLNHLTWRDTNSMFALMEKAITEPAAHESITRVLTVQWGHGTPGAHDLLLRVWELNPTMKAIALDQLNTGYAVWKNREVFFEAFQYFLSAELDKELVQELDETFREFPPEDFLLIQPLLEGYIRACVPRTVHNHFFLDYLAKCVKHFPAECIHLLSLFFDELNKAQPRYPYSRDALKILIEAYTRLPHQNAQDANVQAALDLFDLLLSRSDVRNELNKVMREVSAY